MKRLITPACLVVICLLGLAEVGARVFFTEDISGRFDYGYNINLPAELRAYGYKRGQFFITIGPPF